MRLLKLKKETADTNTEGGKINKKLRLFVIKYFYPVIGLIMIFALAILAVFLYYNVYLSINYAQNVAQLKKQILEEDLMSNDLSQIIDSLNQKNQATPQSLETINNPFRRQWEIKK